MKEILSYLTQLGFNGVYKTDSILGGRYEFSVMGHTIIVKSEPGLTLENFKEKANKEYLFFLKNQATFYSDLAKGFERQIENYTPVFK
jgi:hypothetical protein